MTGTGRAPRVVPAGVDGDAPGTGAELETSHQVVGVHVLAAHKALRSRFDGQGIRQDAAAGAAGQARDDLCARRARRGKKERGVAATGGRGETVEHPLGSPGRRLDEAHVASRCEVDEPLPVAFVAVEDEGLSGEIAAQAVAKKAGQRLGLHGGRSDRAVEQRREPHRVSIRSLR